MCFFQLEIVWIHCSALVCHHLHAAGISPISTDDNGSVATPVCAYAPFSTSLCLTFTCWPQWQCVGVWFGCLWSNSFDKQPNWLSTETTGAFVCWNGATHLLPLWFLFSWQRESQQEEFKAENSVCKWKCWCVRLHVWTLSGELLFTFTYYFIFSGSPLLIS